MPNNGGQFWYGSTTNFPGFLYKKNSRVGTKKITQFAPGGNGVGAHSTSVRRAKIRLATNCNNDMRSCGAFYKHLGRYANYTSNPNGFFIPRPPHAPVVRKFNPSATVSMFGVLPQQLS